MPYEFKITRRVEFSETDMAGIVHFSNFFRFMEYAEHAFFRSLGYSIHGENEGITIGWPRVSAECEYFQPLYFEDDVQIHLLVADIRTRSIRYEFVFRRAGEPQEIARGRITAVCATKDEGTGKLASVAIPEGIREKISVAPSEMLRKVSPKD